MPTKLEMMIAYDTSSLPTMVTCTIVAWQIKQVVSIFLHGS